MSCTNYIPENFTDNNEPFFPNLETNEYFAIQFLNSTGKPLRIWLDNIPMCNKTDICCNRKVNFSDHTLGNFYIYDKNKKKYKSKKTRNQLLEPNEIWKIVPPVNNKKQPYWCVHDHVKNKCTDLYENIFSCVGVGAWFMQDYKNGNESMIPGSIGSRIEFNLNNGSIWFNQSAVDGANANMDVYFKDYIGNQNKKTKCDLCFNECPRIFRGKRDPGDLSGYAPTDIPMCLSPKFLNIKDINLASCPGTTPDAKIQCHKWWSTDTEYAQPWEKFIQGKKIDWSDYYKYQDVYKENIPADDISCQAYSWAYDERRWQPRYEKESDQKHFTKNGDPSDNLFDPLIHIDTLPNKSALNIDIKYILTKEDAVKMGGYLPSKKMYLSTK